MIFCQLWPNMAFIDQIIPYLLSRSLCGGHLLYLFYRFFLCFLIVVFYVLTLLSFQHSLPDCLAPTHVTLRGTLQRCCPLAAMMTDSWTCLPVHDALLLSFQHLLPDCLAPTYVTLNIIRSDYKKPQVFKCQTATYNSVRVALNNSFRSIFNCCWQENPKSLLFYCGTLPALYTVGQRRILLYKKLIHLLYLLYRFFSDFLVLSFMFAAFIAFLYVCMSVWLLRRNQ